MNKTELKLQFEVLKTEDKGIPVIVVAGGSSTRMGQNKQLINVCGLPVLVRTLKVFQQCDGVSNIILVASSENLLEYQNLCEKYMLSKALFS